MAGTLEPQIAELRRTNAELEQRLGEALAREAATAEVLQVINSSPGDLAPVFDAILEKALWLCEAAFGVLIIWDGEQFHSVAFRGVTGDLIEAMSMPRQSVPGTFADRLLHGEDIISSLDLREVDASHLGPGARALLRHGARAHTIVALRKDDRLLGAITIYREQARPFRSEERRV